MFVVKPVKREMVRNPRLGKFQRLSLFQQKWPSLKKSIGEMFQTKYDDVSFGDVYRNTYELVLYNFGSELYENVRMELEGELSKMHKKIRESSKEDFLKTITTTYVSYRQVLTILSNTMHYLDEVHSGGDVKKLFDLGLELFDKHVINAEVLDQLRSDILDQILQDREGKLIEESMIKNAVTILDDLNSYERVIEEPLLKASREYYGDLSKKLISTAANVPEYIQKVQEIVVKEMERVDRYLVKRTSSKLDGVVRDVMVTKHIKFVFEDEESGFLSLMRQRDLQQLGTMYFLFSKNEEQLKMMREKFKQFVFDTGRIYVTSDSQGRPQEFISEIVQMKSVYDDMVKESFKCDKSFEASLNEGFSGFADGTIQKKMASLLSLYVDMVMKRHRTDFEKYLNTAISIFRYLKDQDVFENYYKIHLSKRLLISRLPNERAEKLFISKLKAESGYTFTSKIEGMFNDIRLSKQSMEKFQKSGSFASLKKTLPIDLNVSTLTSSFWPQYEFSNPNLPEELKVCVSSFEKYYKSAHKSRKLTWQNNLGDGIMIARFPVSKHEVSVTTYQMLLLLLFNKHNSLKFEEIEKMTVVPERDLKRNLLLLCLGKYKLLTKSPKSKTVQKDDVFGWNADFKSNNTRLRIGNIKVVRGGIGGLSGKNNGAREEGADGKRESFIEKALMKILRTKRTIPHKELMKRVNALVAGKIDPVPTAIEIKKRIESLILREFVRRSPEDRRVYEYIA